MNYFVDSFLGNDTNPGTREDAPIKSLTKVNGFILNPGDKVLFKRGSVFDNEGLIISARGTEANPIEFASYGDGELPVINANGKPRWYLDYGCKLDADTHVFKGEVSSTVLLKDAEYVTLRDLELTNKEVENKDISEADRMNRTGVAIVARDAGTLHGITIKGLYIHDVHGNVYDKHLTNGGIYCVCLKPEDESRTGVSRFDGLLIEDNTVIDVFRWGIAAGYSYRHGDYKGACLEESIFRESGHTNMVIRNNYVERAGGDAITTMYALMPQVSNNTAVSNAIHMNKVFYKYPGDRRGMVAAGIWPWKCKNAVFECNEVIDTRLNQDGQAYDCDSGDGTIYRDNYSFGNEGGAVMFCMDEAVNNTYRNNTSECDLTGIISPADNPDALIENNTFIVYGDTPLIRKMDAPGKYKLVNNKIINK